MPIQRLPAEPARPSLVLRSLKLLGSLLLGAAILGWVATHAAPPTGTAYIHVFEPDVEVTVDGRWERIEGWNFEPLVFELPSGPHVLRMTRGGQVLYEERFDLGGGEEKILSAHFPPKHSPSPWCRSRCCRERRAGDPR